MARDRSATPQDDPARDGASRADRLKQALRDNLARRKAQGRQRAADHVRADHVRADHVRAGQDPAAGGPPGNGSKGQG
jgi:hypothetical protein